MSAPLYRQRCFTPATSHLIPYSRPHITPHTIPQLATPAYPVTPPPPPPPVHRGEAAAPVVGSALSWIVLAVLLLGWLGGMFAGLTVVTAALPEYELVVENAPAELTLELGPVSYLKLALTPREDSSTLPRLCGFTWDGAALRPWSVPYSHSYRGSLLVKGELRELLPLPAATLGTIRELIFVVSSPLSFCHPAALQGLQHLDALAQPLLGRTVSSLIGTTTLRLPVRLRGP